MSFPDTNFMTGGVEVKLDTALVLEAQKGSQEGFTRLYEAVAPSLYRTALYTLGNSHDAEDVCFRNLYLKRIGDGCFARSTGICSVDLPHSFGKMQSKDTGYVRARNQTDIDQMLELPGEQNEFSETVLERTDLLHALGQLAAEEKQIVILSVIEGYTAKEIAAIVGSPQGTVGSKLFRAFKKMRKHLEGGKQS